MSTATADENASTNVHEEEQYLSLIKQVMEKGSHRPDRTGTGTLSLFAPPSFRFSLRDGVIPLLTTKRVFRRGIIEELLWFVQGCTDGKVLSAKGVNIWEGNGSRDFLDKRGLGHRREGDLGPVYGFQWRHFGAPYEDCESDYRGKGVDQLAEVVRKIKEDPTDRRIIMSAWNPAGVLPFSTMQLELMIRYRYPTNGSPALPYVLPILCSPSRNSRVQAWSIVHDVSTFG